MPNTTITDLVSASTATGAVIPADQAGSTRKVTPEQILNAANGETKPGLPAVEAGTTYTLDTPDDRAILRFSSGSTVTVTVPSLAAGTRVVLIQEGAGQVQLSASGVTLQHPATFDPFTSEENSLIELIWLTSTLVQVVGDLALA